MLRSDRVERIDGHRTGKRDRGHDLPVGTQELQLAVGLSNHLEAFLVDSAVMAPTE